MSNFAGLRLSAYYLNTRRLEALTGAGIPVAAETSLIQNSGDRAIAMRLAVGVGNDVLRSGKIPNLNSLVAASDLDGDRVLGVVWGIFAFRGISDALQRELNGGEPRPATFSGTIPLGDGEYRLSGQLSNSHLYSSTSIEVLTGRKRILIAGQFEFKNSRVNVHPYIIGDMVEDLGDTLRMSWSQSVRVYPELIDSFSKIKETEPAKKAELDALAQLPEEAVKQALAAIIGEPFVPADWGGEKSDLPTNRLSVDGQPISAAFIFKGPSVKGEMHPANMGKRGDQLVRAFDEPVELIVIQHCNKIANSIVRIAESLAMDVRRPRRYCILDGADTARILKTYGKLAAAAFK